MTAFFSDIYPANKNVPSGLIQFFDRQKELSKIEKITEKENALP
ncbi:hypothetical protein [Janthinobacterium sp. SUN137]|nr:hypothetical protein [Janthinobacterium sp. SUN137]MDO8038050.1 hypothetical protein [Janthinobacterium sp. SUN137]